MGHYDTLREEMAERQREEQQQRELRWANTKLKFTPTPCNIGITLEDLKAFMCSFKEEMAQVRAEIQELKRQIDEDIK